MPAQSARLRSVLRLVLPQDAAWSPIWFVDNMRGQPGTISKTRDYTLLFQPPSKPPGQNPSFPSMTYD
jgi:hypothetical protein